MQGSLVIDHAAAKNQLLCSEYAGALLDRLGRFDLRRRLHLACRPRLDPGSVAQLLAGQVLAIRALENAQWGPPLKAWQSVEHLAHNSDVAAQSLPAFDGSLDRRVPLVKWDLIQ